MRERSFLIGTRVSIAIIALVVVSAAGRLRRGGPLTVGAVGEQSARGRGGGAPARARSRPRSPSAASSPTARTSELRDGELDAVLVDGTLRSEEKPDDKLVSELQAADREAQRRGAAAGRRARRRVTATRLRSAPLRASTIEPVDDREDSLGGLAFFAILILYGQLLTYGFWVASGVVEEKASRVVEILLSTIRPRELLPGKVIGLGLLGFGQLLLVAAVGLLVATATGAVDVELRPAGRGRPVAAVVRARLRVLRLRVRVRRLARAAAGGAAGLHDPAHAHHHDLAVRRLRRELDPDGTLAHVSAFIPFTAPMTLPPGSSWAPRRGTSVARARSATTRRGRPDPARRADHSGALLRTGLGGQAARRGWRDDRPSSIVRAADALGVVGVRADHGRGDAALVEGRASSSATKPLPASPTASGPSPTCRPARLRWIATRVPSCGGRTVPLKRRRLARRRRPTFSPTSGATATVTRRGSPPSQS